MANFAHPRTSNGTLGNTREDRASSFSLVFWNQDQVVKLPCTTALEAIRHPMAIHPSAPLFPYVKTYGRGERAAVYGAGHGLASIRTAITPGVLSFS